MANIIRTVRHGGYSLMSDFHLKDRRLSWKAKGFLSVLLCLSGEYRIDELFRIASDRPNEIIAELEKYGYLKILSCGNETEYVVYEKPFAKESSQMPVSELPYAEDVPGEPTSAKCSEEEIERLKERLNLKAIAEKYSDNFVEMVFREVCRRDSEFRQMMTAEAFKRVCFIVWESHSRNSFYKEFGDENIALINRYLDNIVVGIRSAGGGNEKNEGSIEISRSEKSGGKLDMRIRTKA